MKHHFQWSAWDPNKWDHYHHAGVQERFYRQCPTHLSGQGYETMEPRWIDYLINFLGKF